MNHSRQPKIRFIVVSVFTMLALLVLGMPWLHADASATPDDLVRSALVERFPQPDAASLEELPFAVADLRTLTKRQLDAALLQDLRALAGRDFHFATANGRAQVAVLVFSYGDAATATQKAARLGRLGGYFRNTKILTAFSHVAQDAQLIVGFTENAGDQAVTEFVHALPALLGKTAG